MPQRPSDMIHAIAITGVLVASLERVPQLRRRPLRLLRPSTFTDLAFLVVAWLAIAQLTLRWVGWATSSLGSTIVDGIPLPLEAVVALVLLDLGNYLAHWLVHRFETLWRFHAVHHSSPMLDGLATFRSHVGEQLLRRVVAPLGLIAAGASIPAVAIASAVFIGWGIFIHSNLRVNLRFLEPVLVTPRLHHLHHVAASSEQNLGTLLSVWDRLAGRLAVHDVPADTPLGNGDPSYPQTFAGLLRAPFRRSRFAARA